MFTEVFLPSGVVGRVVEFKEERWLVVHETRLFDPDGGLLVFACREGIGQTELPAQLHLIRMQKPTMESVLAVLREQAIGA